MSADHVVVIGAGITGALIAHRLLGDGVAVTVLEAREKGAGSSSRSAACLRQQFTTPATVQAMIHSRRAYERFGEDFGCQGEAGQVLVQNGYLFLHDRPELHDAGERVGERWAAAQANVAMQKAQGLHEVELLSPAAVSERFPQVDGSRLVGATFCPTDGFLHPDLVYMEGFRRVLELGGVLEQNAPVVGGERDAGGRLTSVRTSDGRSFAGDVFVNATNAWAPRVSQLLGGASLPIEPIKRYLYFLKQGGRIAGDELMSWPMIITASRAYCRPENASQLLAGWAHATSSEPDFSWDDQDLIEPPYFHKSGLDNYGYQLWMQLAESMPISGEFAGIEATTGGFYAVTPDHNPLLGFDPAVPNLLHAAGFSGHGAMIGPFTAAVIAAFVHAGVTLPSIQLPTGEVDVRAFHVDRRAQAGEGMVI